MAEKKKILYIVEAMGGGVFTYIVDLANELVNSYDMYIAWISNEIASNVVERDLWIEEGASVGGFEAANEAIGTLVLKFENQERIEEVLGNQNKYVKVKLK